MTVEGGIVPPDHQAFALSAARIQALGVDPSRRPKRQPEWLTFDGPWSSIGGTFTGLTETRRETVRRMSCLDW